MQCLFALPKIGEVSILQVIILISNTGEWTNFLQIGPLCTWYFAKKNIKEKLPFLPDSASRSQLCKAKAVCLAARKKDKITTAPSKTVPIYVGLGEVA